MQSPPPFVLDGVALAIPVLGIALAGFPYQTGWVFSEAACNRLLQSTQVPLR